MGFDKTAMGFIKKHGISDKDLEKTVPVEAVKLDAKKKLYRQSRKQLTEQMALGIKGIPDGACQLACNAGIPVGVIAPTVTLAKNFSIDMFGSDSAIVDYYKNYGKNVNAIEQGITQKYAEAYQRTESCKQQKKEIESTYETIAAQQSADDQTSKFSSVLDQIGPFSIDGKDGGFFLGE